MKIVRDENNKDIILEVVFAENEDPVKCLELLEKIEKDRIDAAAETEKARIDADKTKCEMSHKTNAEIAAIQADAFKHQATMNVLTMLDANMKPVYPLEVANKLIDSEYKDIELTATDEDNITDKVRR